ncbi:MAG: ComF family protein [Flavobacteriia bacterium]|nr:ComF family protein [Flavobacteriia bacterium]
MRCKLCHEILQDQSSGLCAPCIDSIAGWPSEFNPSSLADEIFGGRIEIEAVYLLASFHVESPLRKALHEIKYNGNTALANELGRQLSIRNRIQLTKIESITPVPLHPEKLKLRGYNQSEAIAKGIAEASGIVIQNLLSRKKFTPSQTKLNRNQRWSNVEDAFQLNIKTNLPEHVLLVDDTTTTGATLEACAIQLKKAGVKKISIAALGYATA